MKTFSCELSEKDFEKIETTKANLDLRSNEELLKHVIDVMYIPRCEARAMDILTVESFYSLWIEQIGMNMDEILAGGDLDNLIKEEEGKGGSTIVISGGHGVKKDDFRQLRMLAESDYGGTVICVDSVLRHALERGVTPDYVISLDHQQHVAPWFDHKIVRDNMDKVKMIVSCAIHPDVLRVWKGEKYFLLGNIPAKIFPNVAHTIHIMTKKSVFNCGGNVGTFAWDVSKMFGKTPTAMIGMNFSYPKDTPIEDTDYYPDYYKNSKGDAEAVKKAYKKERNPYFDEAYIIDVVWNQMRNAFMQFLEISTKERGEEMSRTYNCTEGGALISPLMEHMRFEEFLRRWKE